MLSLKKNSEIVIDKVINACKEERKKEISDVSINFIGPCFFNPSICFANI